MVSFLEKQHSLSIDITTPELLPNGAFSFTNIDNEKSSESLASISLIVYDSISIAIWSFKGNNTYIHIPIGIT